MFSFIGSLFGGGRSPISYLSSIFKKKEVEAPTTEIDKSAVKKAEDDERRKRRNLRGKELVGIYNTNKGLGGIQNILGG